MIWNVCPEIAYVSGRGCVGLNFNLSFYLCETVICSVFWSFDIHFLLLFFENITYVRWNWGWILFFEILRSSTWVFVGALETFGGFRVEISFLEIFYWTEIAFWYQKRRPERFPIASTKSFKKSSNSLLLKAPKIDQISIASFCNPIHSEKPLKEHTTDKLTLDKHLWKTLFSRLFCILKQREKKIPCLKLLQTDWGMKFFSIIIFSILLFQSR